MQDFISGLCGFIWELIFRISNAITIYVSGHSTFASIISLSTTNLNTFLDKEIISGTLINMTMTFRELLLYVIPIFLTALTIYLFIKFIVKILGIFKFN